jgi:hypothetical protein
VETGTLNRSIAKILPTNPDAPVKVSTRVWARGQGTRVRLRGQGTRDRVWDRVGVKCFRVRVTLTPNPYP